MEVFNEKLTNINFTGGEKVALPGNILGTDSISGKLSGYVTGNDLNALVSGLGEIVTVLNAAPWKYENDNIPVWSANTEFIKEISGIWTTSGDVSGAINREFIDFINKNKFLTYKALYNYYDICEVNHLFSKLSSSITLNEENLRSHKNTIDLHYTPDGSTLRPFTYGTTSSMFVNIHEIDAIPIASINNSYTLTPANTLHISWYNLNDKQPFPGVGDTDSRNNF
jgi:hypothetical protein